MTFAWRTAVISLAAFAATGFFTSAIIPFLAFRHQSHSARLRAQRLSRLRLLPAAAGAVVGLVALSAFVFFESRKPKESVSVVVEWFAIVAVLVIATAIWRWCQVALVTRRVTREWRADAEPISLDGITTPAFAVSTPFPIVAVVGLFRPTLLIARSVLATCNADELRAVLAHEQGHVNRRDNLRRLAMIIAPDVLAWLPVSARMFSTWCEASEEAADDESAREGADGRLQLASALVKVAKLATGRTAPPAVLTAALYAGDNLDTRVRRLLAPATALGPTRMDALAFGALLAVATVGFATFAPAVHEWIEAVLHALP